jgi:ubiquinone/menaquinone biosynthesis C-methylase UbiE
MTDLRETSLGFYRAWHIALGTKHGFHLALRDASLSPQTLADELGLDERAVERWCEGAWALGLLARDAKRRYRLAKEHALTLGEPSSTEYLGHHFEYLAAKSLTFGALDDLLRGERVRVDLASVYALATRYDHVASLEAMPPVLRTRLAEGIDVLDLGAGLGGWTREAARRYPRSRFTAADLVPDRKAGVVDARKLPRAAFDLVHMGEVLAAARDPIAPLRAAHRALRPGGRLVAIEGLLPPAGRAPKDWGEKLVLAMSLDFSMDGSRFLSALALRRALREAGFAKIALRDLGGSLYLIAARKPETTRRA